MKPLRRLFRSTPLRLLVVALVVYGFTAGLSLRRHSLAPHFLYLAESLLHGRLDLIHVPDPPYDLTPLAGRWYVSFPPLPALLMLPLVALRGLAVSDIACSVVLGAVDVALFCVLLSRPLAACGPRERVWFALLLALGTPLWYCAALGSVWYTAHVAAVACLILYAREALGRNRPLLTGLWLGLGFLARAPLLLAFPLSLALGLAGPQQPWREKVGPAVRFLLLLAAGMAPALLGQAAYNWARFHSPFEFGYRWMNSPGALLARQATWGQFSLHFFPENLYTMLVRPPLVSLAPLRVTPDPWGMGLLLTCPALLLALPALKGVWRDRLRLGLWLSVAAVQLPSLLYFNTGSYQFGYRFALDWLPLGLLLVSLGVGGRLRWWGKLLIVVAVLMHLWGVLWMYPNFNGVSWLAQAVELARRLAR
jgi:hypothetical protein